MADYVPYPCTEPPQATLLFVGFQDGNPWILEVDKQGTDTFYGDTYGNFAAIGSGGTHAHASFRTHLMKAWDLKAGKLHAYRIIDDAIEVAAFFLARPIQIHTISPGGTVVKLTAEELKATEDLCGAWRELERETVGQLLAPAATPTPLPEEPLPEPIPPAKP